MNIAYFIPRLIRHFMPESLADWMKKRRVIIKAGIETLKPKAAAERYLDYFHRENISITDKIVLQFGYGGNILTACELLHAGAAKIIACERADFPSPVFDESLRHAYPDYFHQESNCIQPNPDFIQIIHEDIRKVADEQKIEKVDMVVSSSVFEHLDDVDGITKSLADLTKARGRHIHFVDLRDHYFKYPFEMLTFSEQVWENWLNPTSNLNRFRLPQYEEIFRKYFSNIQIQIQESNPSSFLHVKHRIRKEFLSGDDMIDAVTLITVKASK